MGGGRIVEVGGGKAIGMETGTPLTEAEKIAGKPGSGPSTDSPVAPFANPPAPSAEASRLARLAEGIAGDLPEGTARSRRPATGPAVSSALTADLPSSKYSALADIGREFTQLASALLTLLVRWVETAGTGFSSAGEPAASAGEAARDIALLQTSGTERVPGLTVELAAAFEKGARIVRGPDGTYRWVGEGKPKADNPTAQANEANFRIGESWQSSEGFGDGNPQGLQQAWVNLRSSAQDRGIAISYERPLLKQGSAPSAVEVLRPEVVDVLGNTELVSVAKQIDYLSQLLNLLPPSYFKDGGIREIRIALHPAKRGVNSAHVEVKDGILQIGLAQLRGSRANFIAAFFRGIGQVAVEKLATNPQLQGVYQSLKLGEAPSLGKFISEFTMLYITAGDKLRETIASSAAKDSWQAVYEKMRDEVFGGKEYFKFEEPAASSPGGAVAETPVFPKVWTGGAISKWDFPTVSSVGFLGQVQEVRADGVVVLSAVKYLKDGQPVEEIVSVEIQSPRLRGTAPVAGQWVHYSPARPRTSSEPDAFQAGARTVMVEREAMVGDRRVDEVFVDTTVTIEKAKLQVSEANGVNGAATTSTAAEVAASAELPVAKSYSADELGQRVYAVHVLSRDIPADKWPRFIKDRTLLAQAREDAFNPVLHWTLGNTPVNTVGNRRAKSNFAIVVPVGKLEGIVNVSPESTTTLGDTPIPREAVVLAPQYVDVSAFTAAGLKVVHYTGDLQAAVGKYIKDNRGLDIECKRDAQANLTPDIRVDGARVLDPLGFFKPLLSQRYMSYGDGVLGVKGDGFRFGVLDGLMEATVKSYGVYSDVPGLGKDAQPINRTDLQVRRELLAHHILKLEGWLLSVESTGKFSSGQIGFFKANLENASSLLNFIDADLKVRSETGSKNKEGIGLTFNFAAQTGYYLYLGRKKMHQKGDKIEEAKRDMLNERPDIGPNLGILVTGMMGMPSREFMEFVDQSKALKSNGPLKQQLILSYAMRRWMVLSLQEAQREGLDTLMSKALDKVGRGQTMKLKAFFKAYTDQGGNAAAAAAALEREPFIQRYYAENP